MSLTKEQTIRYSRHILLPDVGVKGQEKLLNAKVLIVGAGGLGAPVSIYLTAAGVGTIGIVEFDEVDLSNLQRQILYNTKSIGSPKIEIAEKRLKEINPDVTILTYNEPLTEKNALTIFKGFDYIVDATDNFATRYLINDACVLLRKTYIYGSIFDFEGQISVLGAKDYPCYRCLFPSPPEKENIPGCLDKGVFGLLPGVVGSIQATETIKQITEIGTPLLGRLLLYDCLEMTMREMKVKRDKNCPICGDNPHIKALSGYESIRGIEPESDTAIQMIGVEDFLYRVNRSENITIMDVREGSERKEIFMENTLNIPLNTIKDRLSDFAEHKEKPVVVLCQTGIMAICAAKVLMASGFEDVQVLENGLDGILENSKTALHLE